MDRFTSHVRRCAQTLLPRLAVIGVIGGYSIIPGYPQPDPPLAAGFSHHVPCGINTFRLAQSPGAIAAVKRDVEG